jgi:hypothetical protein
VFQYKWVNILQEENSGNANFWSCSLNKGFTFYLNTCCWQWMLWWSQKPYMVQKIWNPILDHLNTKCRCMYTPHYYVSIDDSLTVWKGHLCWKVHIPTKCATFGINVILIFWSQILLCVGFYFLHYASYYF